jgi:hypothetical protein
LAIGPILLYDTLEQRTDKFIPELHILRICATPVKVIFIVVVQHLQAQADFALQFPQAISFVEMLAECRHDAVVGEEGWTRNPYSPILSVATNIESPLAEDVIG